MKNCDCSERVETKINSWSQFEEIKNFFEERKRENVFIDLPVTKPYYIGYSADGKAMSWYADKWYKCRECGVIWEVVYPEFPAQGFVKKIMSTQQ